jgi:AcrR family transcriptional regulator
MTGIPAARLGPQALKTQRTRARLIQASIALIRERGLSAATAQRVAKRAGVTWGAAQHQFGSKARMLDAVLAAAYERFIEAMSDPALRHGPRTTRARLFVQRMWAHYQGDHYRVAVEILRATRGQRARAWEERQGRAHLRAVREVFGESRLSDARLREALTYAHCCLTGLSMEHIFERRVRHVDRHLKRVAVALASMLGER